jgi:hypothetical protein
MNSKIANIIVSYLTPLAWVDKIAGMTQIAQMKQGEVVKRFPVSCDMSADDCVEGCYDELMPSSKRRSVLFFEDGSFTFSRQQGNRIYYESRLRLVCWLNYKLIDGGCGSSGDYIISILKALPAMPQNVGDLLALSVTVQSQVPRSPAIFSKYTFDELHSQYLMIPYDYFALEIITRFHIVTECIEPAPGGCTEC